MKSKIYYNKKLVLKLTNQKQKSNNIMNGKWEKNKF